MPRFSESTWADIEALRASMLERHPRTVCDAAGSFTKDFADRFASVVLARTFIVLPYGVLPPDESAAAATIAGDDGRLGPKTRVLSLLGSAGRESRWCDRTLSEGHRAIPLLDRAFVQNIPMVASLLADLEADLAGLDDGRSIASQRMLGGRNGKFFVADAQSVTDAAGRYVIPSRDFVTRYAVRTVFGMGGAYLDGSLAITVIFTDELIDPIVAGRFPSLISTFKLATMTLLMNGQTYE